MGKILHKKTTQMVYMTCSLNKQYNSLQKVLVTELNYHQFLYEP